MIFMVWGLSIRIMCCRYKWAYWSEAGSPVSSHFTYGVWWNMEKRAAKKLARLS